MPIAYYFPWPYHIFGLIYLVYLVISNFHLSVSRFHQEFIISIWNLGPIVGWRHPVLKLCRPRSQLSDISDLIAAKLHHHHHRHHHHHWHHHLHFQFIKTITLILSMAIASIWYFWSDSWWAGSYPKRSGSTDSSYLTFSAQTSPISSLLSLYLSHYKPQHFIWPSQHRLFLFLLIISYSIRIKLL